MVMDQEKMEKKSTKGDAADQRKKRKLATETANGPKACGKQPHKIDRERERVRKVCALVTGARIFPTFDNSLLEMIAEYESNFGKEKTDAKGSPAPGGIWRIHRTGFEDTRNLYFHPHLEEFYIRIYKAFNIKWTKVEWKDMDTPLLSALAAGMLIDISNKGLFPTGQDGKMIVRKKDVARGLYHSSSMKNYDSVRTKKKVTPPGMLYPETQKKSSPSAIPQLALPRSADGKNSHVKSRKTEKAAVSSNRAKETVPRTLPRSIGVQGRPVKPAFGGARKGVQQKTASAKCQQGRLERKPMAQRVTTPLHPHKEGKPANVLGSGSDSDMRYSISDSDLGLCADDASHDEDASVSFSTEDVSSEGSHDCTAESDSSEYDSGSSETQEQSQSAASDESYDGSEDDESESTELSDEDESDFSDGSRSDDSFDDSDETEDEEDPDHVYDDPSSDSDSEWSEESYGALEQESEEHIYDDPAELLDSDPIYEDPDDLYD